MKFSHWKTAVLCSLALLTACNGSSSDFNGTALRPINDTGITLCGNYAYDGGSGNHKNDLDCAAVGASQTAAGTDTDGDPVPAGQDAVYGRDAMAEAGTLSKVGAGAAGFDFSKLDSNGDELPLGATDWRCVRDNHTGLVWEVKTDDGGLHDRDNTYTWYNPDSSTNGGVAGLQDGGTCSGSACDTQAYVNAVNASGLCGISEWRMPTVVELIGIVHNGVSDPAIDTDFFSNTPTTFLTGASLTWTSATFSDDTDYALAVNFSRGRVTSEEKSIGGQWVRLVYPAQSEPDVQSNDVACSYDENTAISATTPTSDFIFHDDGTVTHKLTGLMWSRCQVGQSWDGSMCTGTETKGNWEEIMEAAQSSNYAGYSDWRLPNKNELVTIIERRCSNPSLNDAVFFESLAGSFWTSSPAGDGAAWDVDILGHVSPFVASGNMNGYLVRDIE